MNPSLADELHYLRWFHDNCDFGPADGDVRDILQDEYLQKTGRKIPSEYVIREDNPQFCVYLCGPIADRCDHDVFGWRNHFKLIFQGTTKDPSRRDYRDVVVTKEIAQVIVDDDLADIDSCQALVIHYDRPSVGSSQEVFYAHRVLGIPVVIINVSGNPNISPWLLNHSDAVVTSIPDAASLLNTYL